MIYPAIPLAQTVLELCKANQIKHIVISPGSRNAPLTIGFSHDDYFTCYSIVDERVAAFFALGMAQQIDSPVAIVCTSGSALLNYYPAIAEAFYSDIPLVVISADRPTDKIDIGDGQTIRQTNVFANHIVYTANLKQDIPHQLAIHGDGKHQDLPLIDVSSTVQLYNEQEISKALHAAFLEKGPVHINAPFEEPLYKTLHAPLVTVKEYPRPFHPDVISSESLHQFVESWNTSKKKMILVGVLKPNSVEEKIIEYLAADSSVVVFTETTSNLHNDNFFPGIDKILAPIEQVPEELEKLQPELLLTFGGMVVSKKIKAFLRKYSPKLHFHVDEKKAYDTFFCLTHHFKVTVNSFFSYAFDDLQKVDSNYQLYWLEVQKQRRIAHKAYASEIQYSDFLVYDCIFHNLPNNQLLQLSNSSTIRYMQLFDLDASWTVFCNRGTSGIDGSTSTAMGASIYSDTPTTLITGDLSFLYDSNGLWNNYVRKDMTIIVVNNGGGGIFRILPGDKNTKEFDTYFETIHNKDASHLAAMYGFEYVSASSKDEVVTQLTTVYDNVNNRNKPVILEIFTPRLENDEILISYFKYLRNHRA
ncbi:2-succinyl-5-enolpyruvyl-6-hydroxy-3-cyclohexene-1-carboxylic-acid synthase [Neptunitalea lumnitzerae]|uniref:2-succinyl-5-enolpyruvyl-6-hydroxy-3-cyclohexene-1-carboxylate synthase n=1 Tax=Neptunitalea lumnitzerae TaxID=2965509 RepID=A0ABQ5MID5_9FLAO|nr:2-succinyl-5-enolpyruvyl-6-hydroxy-3-cyclohexene-1-carboxylic-acid synthase [Neptunitalea sp. Y10]GLB49163.1 2-succinyl-5-enolpyruvyl-6-hydroxy-3-cyclohexene- 1-carboxylate synthase [Neptunitalea sp. Y10]